MLFLRRGDSVETVPAIVYALGVRGVGGGGFFDWHT